MSPATTAALAGSGPALQQRTPTQPLEAGPAPLALGSQQDPSTNSAALQTPSISVGKTVVRGKTGDKGTVLAVDGDKARVLWGEGSERRRPVKLDMLLVPPIANSADLRPPTAVGQIVLINAGSHAHKQGIICSFNM